MKEAFVFTCIILLILAGSAKAVSAQKVQHIDLATTYLIVNPVSKTLYASIPGSEGVLGNSIVPIDPATGSLGTAVPVGSEPRHLAISDDGTTLYAYLSGEFAIRRVDLTTMTAGLRFSLGFDPRNGLYWAEDIAVQPGDPDVLAVSRRAGTANRGIAIFDNGVQRANTTKEITGPNCIEFSNSADTIYGYENDGSGFYFFELRVDPDGVTIIDDWQYLFSGFYVDIEFASGRVYSSNGTAVSPLGPTVLGTYSGVGPRVHAVAVDPAENRVYSLTSRIEGPNNEPVENSYAIEVFDLTTFVLLNRLPVPSANGTPYNLVQWGPGKLAFRTDEEQVFFVDLFAAPADTDEDGIADKDDSCPLIPNSDQSDQDGDKLGDVCDPFPNHSNNELAQCQGEVDACQANLEDDDKDGEFDITDLCLGTGAGMPVDDSGCSIEQFCSQYTVKKDCLKADWKNDEPAISNPKDCMAVKLDKKTISCQPYPEG
jgi:DNA-binding beta-propeller fold protein YncE